MRVVISFQTKSDTWNLGTLGVLYKLPLVTVKLKTLTLKRSQNFDVKLQLGPLCFNEAFFFDNAFFLFSMNTYVLTLFIPKIFPKKPNKQLSTYLH